MAINEPDVVDAAVTSVCISLNGRLVAAGCLDAVVRIWDVATGQLVERLKGHQDSVYSIAFTQDGRGLISGSLDRTLKHWDIQPILDSLPSSTVNAKSKNPNKNDASEGRERNARIGKPLTRGEEAVGGGESGSQCMMNFDGHKDYVLGVAVSYDGQWIVSGSKDQSVRFWNVKTGVAQCTLLGHERSGALTRFGLGLDDVIAVDCD